MPSATNAPNRASAARARKNQATIPSVNVTSQICKNQLIVRQVPAHPRSNRISPIIIYTTSIPNIGARGTPSSVGLSGSALSRTNSATLLIIMWFAACMAL